MPGLEKYVYKIFDKEKDVFVKINKNKYALWSENIPLQSSASEATLTNFYINSKETSSWESNYYINVYKDSEIKSSNQQLLFSIAFGTHSPITSSYINTLDKFNSNYIYAYPSYAIYRQLITNLEGGLSSDKFLIPKSVSSGSENFTMYSIYALSFSRDLFKNQIDTKDFKLILTGSGQWSYIDGSGNIKYAYSPSSGSIAVITCDTSSKYYTLDNLTEKYLLIISSSGLATSTGSIGWLYPEKGMAIFKADSLHYYLGGSGLYHTSGSTQLYATYSVAMDIYDNFGNLSKSAAKFYPKSSIYSMLGWIQDGKNFTGYSLNEDKSSYYFCRINSYEYLNSLNPTWISGSIGVITDGNKTYITSVGLYDEYYNLVAVAKLSRPVKKDDVTNLTIQIKLDY